MQSAKSWHRRNSATHAGLVHCFAPGRRSIRQHKMSSILVAVTDIIIHESFPGCRPVSIVPAAIGLASKALTSVFSVVPAEGQPNNVLAAAKNYRWIGSARWSGLGRVSLLTIE